MTEPELLPAEAGQEEKKNHPPAKNRSNLGVWLVVLINFIGFAAIAGAGAWFWKQHYQPLKQQVETQQTATVTLNTVEQAQSLLHASLKQLEEVQQSTENRIAGLSAASQLTNQELAAVQKRVSEQDSASTSDWLIAEAEYLVRMAGRKLWLEGDVRTAVLMLKEADKRLADTADPALFPARNSIAGDIQRLEQSNPVSTTSIALSLSGLLSTVDNLPLNALQLPEADTQGPAQVSEDISDWRDNLSRVWDSVMDDFVTIRKRNAAVEPMMSEAQIFLAREGVKLSLMQAQSAALKHQVTLYQQSLQQAVTGLVEHFDIQHHQVEQFLGAIRNLQETNVEKDLPQALVSQEVLTRALESRANRLENGSLAL